MRRGRLWPIVTLAAILAPFAASPAARQATPAAPSTGAAAQVLVVYNQRYKESRTVADYYMAQRHIPDKNKCAIDAETPGPNTYLAGGLVGYHDSIKAPVQKCLNALGKENILYVVFSYMTPFKVFDGFPLNNVRAIDSLVANIWDPNETNPSLNRYFSREASPADVPFVTLEEWRRANPGVVTYSVWRLDGATAATSKGLVDKAIASEATGPAGRGCFDRRYPQLGPDAAYTAGDWDIQRSADLVTAAGFQVTLDTNDQEFGAAPAPLRCEDAAFYGGWYSFGHYNDAFSWAPGAMGWHLDSASMPNPHDTQNWGGGALARGITITTGVVGEPGLENLPHLDSFFKAVLQGARVGDAMLRSTRALSWMNLNVGDPLYAPFARAPRFRPKTR
jgi:uncharacterized protein (TIGR03790 family)